MMNLKKFLLKIAHVIILMTIKFEDFDFGKILIEKYHTKTF